MSSATPNPAAQNDLATRPAKRQIAVGITGKPSKLCVTLYDVANNYSSGVDLYFNDVADVLDTLKAINEQVDAGKDWFTEQLSPATAEAEGR